MMKRLRAERFGPTTIVGLLVDRRGIAAVLFALVLPALLMSTGAAVDLARVGMLKRSMQSVADSAALAGASALCLQQGQTDPTQIATDYFNKSSIPIARYAAVGSPTVTVPSSIEVTVTASATLTNTMMSSLSSAFLNAVGSSPTVSVTSSAEGPGYNLQLSMSSSGFSASAGDGNSIYYYEVPSNGSVPTSTASMTLLFTNDANVDPNYKTDNNATKNIRVGPNGEIGFALVNVTDDVSQDGQNNSYGAKPGSVHFFYSSLTAPSMNAYTTQPTYKTGSTSGSTCSSTAITSTNNSYVENVPYGTCGSHPCTTLNGQVVFQNNLLVNNSCSTSSVTSLTCQQLSQSTTFAWNDMGGGRGDDYDYNDAVYSLQCSATETSSPNSVVLVH